MVSPTYTIGMIKMYHGTEDADTFERDERTLWVTDSRELAGLYGEIVEIELPADARILEAPIATRGELIEIPADVAAETEWLIGDDTEAPYDILADIVHESGLYDVIDYGYISDTPDGSNGTPGRVYAVIA